MCMKPNPRVIDPCMRNIISFLNNRGIKTLACCCGHRRYPPTIVVAYGITGAPYEIFSDRFIHKSNMQYKKTRFYLKDKKGYFYIPETVKT